MISSAQILIAEDDSGLRRAAASALTRAGYTVVAAEDGERALADARERPIDLFLVDLIMPGLNGFQLSQELRKFTAAAIIVWTTSGQREMIQQAFASGADDLVSKTHGFHRVLARIERLLAWSNGRMPQLPIPLRAGKLRLDQLFGTTQTREQHVLISPVECQFLRTLLQAPNGQVTRQQLADDLFGDDLAYSLDGVDIIAERLRRKVEASQERPNWLTLNDAGMYRLVLDGAPTPT